ncbi:MAG: zinc metallopeptidase [Planctomycetes bacterium]|nr:zinc metallopeptidase [Planctomycetota bacterium]
MLAFVLTTNPVYWLILGVGLVLSLVAAGRVKSTFARWSQVRARSGIRGAQVAQAILQAHGIHDVRVEPVAGSLTDHYDPSSKTLRLSEPVYHSDSIAALGVAAHEVGHAIQHATRYAPLNFRSAWVPVAGIGSGLGEVLVVIGLFMAGGGGSMLVAWIGLALFATTTVFTVVTLPVEFDASRRAMATLEQSRVLAADELPGARSVLNAAAMTYIAAAAVSLMQLLWWLFQILGSQRRDD